MDIVSLLFYPTWLKAVSDERHIEAGAVVPCEDRRHRADDGVPDWRRVLAPFAVMVVVGLAGALLLPGA